MRLIDADALKRDTLDLPNCYNGFSDTYDKACIIGMIDEQPTIIKFEGDINKVIVKGEEYHRIVKCKDCKYWKDQEEGVIEVPICARPEAKYEKLPFRFMIGKDGFCSFAERRIDE